MLNIFKKFVSRKEPTAAMDNQQLKMLMNQCAEQAALSVVLHIESRMRLHYAEHHKEISGSTVEEATKLCATTGKCAVENLTIALIH